MGQYYQIVNLDKQEYLHPHKFGDGLKLLEFGASAMGTLTGLTILLADGNNRGGGDLYSDNLIIGSWAGDRIVIAGDYADEGNFIPGSVEDPETWTLYSYAQEYFEDISELVIAAMRDDEYLDQALKERNGSFGARL